MEMDLEQVRQRIVNAAPERCRPCHRVQLDALWMSRRIIDNEITIEEVTQNLQSNLKQNCQYGMTEPQGCFGSGQCSYGVLCHYPDRNISWLAQNEA